MPVEMDPLFGAANTAVFGMVAGLSWIGQNLANELLLFSSLLLSVSLWLGPRRGARSIQRSLAAVSVIAMLISLIGIAETLRANAGAAAVGKLTAASLLAAFSLAILWRSSSRNIGRRLDGEEDLERLRLLAAAVTASEDGVMIAEAGRGDESAAADRVCQSGIRADDGLQRRRGGRPEPERAGRRRGTRHAEPDPRCPSRHRSRRGWKCRAAARTAASMWTEWQIVPVADARGRLTHSVAVLRDTTLRRGAEQALRESEARFRGLFEQAADAILVLDAKGRHRRCQSPGLPLPRLHGRAN